jgi:hypothetical protein
MSDQPTEEHQPRVMISPLAKLLVNQLRPNTEESMKKAKITVDEFIPKTKVSIFSKTYCPRCTMKILF